MKIRHIHLEETNSTNDYIKTLALEQGEMVVVSTDWQTSGRGQGTNCWESERAQNLLFSVMAQPLCVSAQQQFVLSMAGALAIKEVLDQFSPYFSIKWPNDIYWHDRKISGTLIETSLARGQISRFVYGIGLNVNQQHFLSDAPNPVSLVQITGQPLSPMPLLNCIVQSFQQQLQLVQEGKIPLITTRYNASLFRSAGFHLYSDEQGVFEAELVGVETNGLMTLRDKQKQLRTYTQPHATNSPTANKLRFVL